MDKSLSTNKLSNEVNKLKYIYVIRSQNSHKFNMTNIKTNSFKQKFEILVNNL